MLCTIYTIFTLISSLECGGIFKAKSSTFTSPNYPTNYASGLYCEWYLEVEDSHRLSLSFNDFSVEDSCVHDSVKVNSINKKKKISLASALLSY